MKQWKELLRSWTRHRGRCWWSGPSREVRVWSRNRTMLTGSKRTFRSSGGIYLRKTLRRSAGSQIRYQNHALLFWSFHDPNNKNHDLSLQKRVLDGEDLFVNKEAGPVRSIADLWDHEDWTYVCNPADSCYPFAVMTKYIWKIKHVKPGKGLLNSSCSSVMFVISSVSPCYLERLMVLGTGFSEYPFYRALLLQEVKWVFRFAGCFFIVMFNYKQFAFTVANFDWRLLLFPAWTHGEAIRYWVNSYLELKVTKTNK